jgi:hypothetical protein
MAPFPLTAGVRGDFRAVDLRMRRSPDQRPSCAIIVFKAGSCIQKCLVASKVTKRRRSKSLIWIGNKQARTLLQQTKAYKRERQVVIDQEERASEIERGLRGTTAGSVKRAARPIFIPG